jgi:hypothetical protein
VELVFKSCLTVLPPIDSDPKEREKRRERYERERERERETDTGEFGSQRREQFLCKFN